MPTFDLTHLASALAQTRFASHLHHLPTVTSTNTLALEAAHAGASTGVWIADEQTAGRGRGEHTWHSPLASDPAHPAEPAGLYLSVLVRPDLTPTRTLWLSLATALAARQAIASTTTLTPDIRWPNDLLLNQRKLGGILVETASNPATPSGPATLRHVVIGIGLNLNQLAFPVALEPIATSLRRELPGHPTLPREPLAAALLLALNDEITRLESPHAQDLLARFNQASTWVTGKRVRIEPRPDHPDSYTGTTAGLDPHGFLRVLTDSGQLQTVLSGGLREL